MTLQICVQISVVNGPVPPLDQVMLGNGKCLCIETKRCQHVFLASNVYIYRLSIF